METPITNETIFYQDSTVLVTQTRYITNSKTYAMRNISSVHIFEVIKSRKHPLVIVVIGLLMLFSEQSRITGAFIVAIGLVFLFFIKNEFAVRISTNSGELNSIVSKDRMYIETIVEALNKAIIQIG